MLQKLSSSCLGSTLNQVLIYQQKKTTTFKRDTSFTANYRSIITKLRANYSSSFLYILWLKYTPTKPVFTAKGRDPPPPQKKSLIFHMVFLLLYDRRWIFFFVRTTMCVKIQIGNILLQVLPQTLQAKGSYIENVSCLVTHTHTHAYKT